MQSFVHARMEESLIESEALQAAVDLSGGVFREMAFVMQLTASHVIERGSNRIEVVDVERAKSRIRSDFRRILTDEDYELLKEVRTSNEMRSVDKLADLLHTLAVLEYTNDENWCDVHPSLRKLLGEEE